MATNTERRTRKERTNTGAVDTKQNDERKNGNANKRKEKSLKQ
jgi:hypothetical protein